MPPSLTRAKENPRSGAIRSSLGPPRPVVRHAPPTAPQSSPLRMLPSPKPRHVRHIPEAEQGLELDAPVSPSPIKIRRPSGLFKVLSDSVPHAPSEPRTPKVVPRSPHRKRVRTLLRPANTDEVLASPTPKRSTARARPSLLLAQSTPLPLHGRRPHLPLHRLPSRMRETREAQASTPAAAREPSPLPPSSPPAESEPSLLPELEPDYDPGFDMYTEEGAEVDEEEEDKENNAAYKPAIAVSAQQDRLSEEDDPFGILAAERKLKAKRQPSAPPQGKGKGKEPVVPRRPLGTLTIALPSPSPVPSTHSPAQLPTPASEDEHNIDDLYLDISSPRMQPRAGPSTEVADWAFAEDDYADENVEADEDKENAPPTITVPNLLQPASSTLSSPQRDPLGTPHKPRSARKRALLPSSSSSWSSELAEPFAVTGVPRTRSRSRGLGAEEWSSPSRAANARHASSARRESSARRASALPPAGEETGRQRAVEVKPVQRQKRKRPAEESDEDPMEAALSMLPKRPVKRPTRSTAAPARGRDRGRGRGRAQVQAARESGSESGRESESESESESGGESEPTTKKATRGGTARGRSTSRGRGTSRGTSRGGGRGAGRGRGRGRGRGKATGAGASRSPSRAAQDKGKKRARDEAELDTEEEEERTRARAARIEYFRKLDKEYSLEKEDVYVI
ncbi:hypothetical protein IEO21_06592 [Rhodonia placenta]|uniref:Uncharacterized protein n=1 Tax=Rhodonia placenta TaxID=104341 RepID=A0A8H7U0G5_9APHY|nr:hypothetical protein IEO21_06592 [Postia placenta]